MSEPTLHDPQRARFAPRATREMAGMFDHVAGRYDWLNRLMTLGQDAGWRVAMAAAVPDDARVVLDLCTGSGVSTARLRRPGRTVLGIDVSLGMLHEAEHEHGGTGWAPRFVCADGFTLPLPDHRVDAVTIAFGIRNLRPRPAALAEVARVLRPGGVLVVLEATAPGPGPIAPLARAWIRRGIPLMGRLSPDPSAYDYLARSIFDFGSGVEFERDLAGSGFTIAYRRAFMFGATRLWTARTTGPIAVIGPAAVQAARPGGNPPATPAPAARPADPSRGVWAWLDAGVAAALLVAFVWGAFAFGKWARDLPLASWQRAATWVLLGLGIVAFSLRVILLTRRASGIGPSR